MDCGSNQTHGYPISKVVVSNVLNFSIAPIKAHSSKATHAIRIISPSKCTETLTYAQLFHKLFTKLANPLKKQYEKNLIHDLIITKSMNFTC